jgi:hypothetical protein
MILFTLFVLIMPLYLSHKLRISNSRIFRFSMIPPLLFTAIAGVFYVFMNLFLSSKDFSLFFIAIPLISYFFLYPPLIFSSLMIIYLETYYPQPLKIFMLEGAIIAYINLSLYMIFVFKSFHAPLAGWYYPALGSSIMALSILLLDYYKKRKEIA